MSSLFYTIIVQISGPVVLFLFVSGLWTRAGYETNNEEKKI